MSLPNPSEETIKKIQNLCYNRSWNNGRDKVKRNGVVKSCKMGGLTMLDVKKFITSLISTWLRKLLCKLSKYFDFLNTTYPFVSNISCFGGDFIKRKLHLVNNPFWKDVFDSYILLDENITIKKDNCLTLPLWHTRLFRIAGNSVFYKHFYEVGILFVNDLLNEIGYFHSFDSFIQKWNGRTNFLQFSSLSNCVKRILAANNIEEPLQNYEHPLQPLSVTLLCSTTKGAAVTYIIYCLLSSVLPTLKSQNKWRI